MVSVRLADAAAVAMAGLLLLLSLGADGIARAGAVASVVVLAAAYVVVGRRALRASTDAEPADDARPAPAAIAFLAVAIPAAAWGAASASELAVVQCVLCPLVWLVLPRVRDAIVGTVALTGSIAAGFLLGFGSEPVMLVTAAVTQGLSLAGSIALGLWITRISVLSRERLELLEGLRAAQAQVEDLGREAGAARERARLSADLHDTVAQDLTALVMLAQRGRRELRAGDDERAAGTLDALESGARAALTETRAIVAATAPVQLEDGVGAALARLGARFSRETGLPVVVDADGAAPLDRDAEVVLLRCAQEGLANVRRHADAAAVGLSLGTDGDDAVLRIRDDGRGFDPSRASAGYGLEGMRRRLGEAGGRLDIATGADGTVLTARIPGRAPLPDAAPRPAASLPATAGA
ncbi:sensor histidine kinase [Clavibacter zhangzhiyongii]|uniref:sensor histidine kinase n=1 Tax=Clavibacter zhangzhiyongii TaxID=2768071 RepID=UPI001F34EDA3|nr:sensor histidine kinase [Clavibacter zhangzhiyongii]